jgi:hypothetical protein
MIFLITHTALHPKIHVLIVVRHTTERVTTIQKRNGSTPKREFREKGKGKEDAGTGQIMLWAGRKLV